MQTLIFGSLITASVLLAFGLATGAATALNVDQPRSRIAQATPLVAVVYWAADRGARF